MNTIETMYGQPHKILCGKDASVLSKWVFLANYGVNKAKGKEYVIDDEAFARIESAFAAKGIDLVVDFEHQTHGALTDSPAKDGRAPAAGWISKLELNKVGRDGRGPGVYGLVAWVGDTPELLTSKRYRYISPTMVVNDDGLVNEIVSAGLTNFPAIHGMRPVLNRRTSASGVNAMKTGGLRAGITATNKLVTFADDGAQVADSAASDLFSKIRAKVGAPDGATMSEVFSMILEKLGGNEADPAANKELAAHKAGLDAMKAQLTELSHQLSQVTARNTALETANKASRLDAIVAEAESAGRITPAMKVACKETYASLFKADDGVSLKAMFDSFPAIVPQGQNTGAGGVPGNAGRQTVIAKGIEAVKSAAPNSERAFKISMLNGQLEAEGQTVLSKDEADKIAF